MELIKMNTSLPLRSYPQKDLDVVLKTEFKYFIAGLLSLDNTKNEEFENTLEALKDQCKGLGLVEVKQMFELYADSKLDIEPITNHFNRVLVGRIRESYRRYQRRKPATKKGFDKAESDMIHAITTFDDWKQGIKIPLEMVWIYEYLVFTKAIMPEPGKEQKIASVSVLSEKHPQEDKDKINDRAKIEFIEHYFSTLHAKDKHLKDEL